MKISTCLGLFSLTLAACSSPAVNSNAGRLQANNDAQHFGIAAYEMQSDGAILFDQNGIELGTMVISAPVAERRLIQFELVNGTTDEVEVYRPKADGTFFAPIVPQTVSTAALADPALAPLFAKHALTFKVETAPLLAPTAGAVAAEALANTTVCNGGCQTGKPWTCTTPIGCVRSANTSACVGSVCCKNASQLPPTIYWNDPYAIIAMNEYYGTYDDCMAGITDFCDQTVGPGNYGSVGCVNGDYPVEGDCYAHWTISQWIASCPEDGSNCTVAGQYDAVPRQDSCLDPGSCSFTQGNVSCTTYH